MTHAFRTILLASVGVAATGLIVAALLWWRSPSPAVPPMESTAEEDGLLAASHGLAWREAALLHLRLKSGEVLTLTDHQRCGDLACPAALATRYRYAGWDEAIGGYRLQVSMGGSQPMVLRYGDDEPTLIDARHAAPSDMPVPMPATAPPAVATDDSLAEWLADLTAQREQSEKPLIDARAGRVSRQQGTLTLTLGHGGSPRTLTLDDDLVCGQVACPPQISRSFDYAGESPDRQFAVVQQQWNEAEEGLLIDQQGGVLVTLSAPSFSPDGAVAVAVLSDLEAAAPRRLEVWALGDGKPSLAFSVAAPEEDDIIYELVGWVDATHLRLKRGPWGSDQRSQVMLVKDTAGWHIEEG